MWHLVLQNDAFLSRGMIMAFRCSDITACCGLACTQSAFVRILTLTCPVLLAVFSFSYSSLTVTFSLILLFSFYISLNSGNNVGFKFMLGKEKLNLWLSFSSNFQLKLGRKWRFISMRSALFFFCNSSLKALFFLIMSYIFLADIP